MLILSPVSMVPILFPLWSLFSFFLLSLDLICCCCCCYFSTSLKYTVRWFIWDCYNFIVYVFCYKSTSQFSFAASHSIVLIFICFKTVFFLIPMWLFRDVLFSVHIYNTYKDFPTFLLLFIFSCIPLVIKR